MNERANKRQCLDSTPKKKQSKLTNYIQQCPDFQDCLLNWIISTYQPLVAVQHDSFRKMLSTLNVNAPAVGYDKIRSLMTTKYYDSVHFVKKIVQGKHVSLTTDAWTSIAKEGYVTCTLHFIEPKTWTLHHFSLGIFKKDSTSTARDVIHYAEQHMEDFGITYPQLTCIVTDTESTMIAAGRLFKEKSALSGGNTSWHGCIDHKLELVTKLAFKDSPESNGTMTACHAIVTFFNSSSQATAKLKEKTKARLGVALTVKQDVCTRWWSTFSMCERLLRMKNVLTVMYLDGDIRLCLTEEQWVIVKDLTVLLKPFMVAQKLLEGQSYVTISLIPYMIYKIRNGLTAANVAVESSPQVQSLSTMMLEKFREEFGSGEENSVCFDHINEGNRRRIKGIPKLVLMASLLDPRTKSAIGIPVTDRDVVWEYIVADLVELALSIGPLAPIAIDAAQVIAAPPINRNHNNEDNVNHFLQELNDADDTEEYNDEDLQELNEANIENMGDAARNWDRNTVTHLIHTEVSLFRSANGIQLIDTVTGAFNCPLTWWRLHQNDYPYLAKLAMKLLAIPATSAPSERVFSTAGLTIAKDRARLVSERANELVFLHDSLPEIEKYKNIINNT